MIALLALMTAAVAEDLVVDNETIELSGTHEYRTVLLQNNGRINIPAFDGTSGGSLELICDSFVMSSNSTVRGIGAGYPSLQAFGPGDGDGGDEAGGGGAHGGDGGRGVRSNGEDADGFGGEAYGIESPDFVDMGGAGGGVTDRAGGHGGGAFIVRAAYVQIDGVIRMNGHGGGVNNFIAGGGGAGGGILIVADQIDCGGSLDANGGDGGSSGGAKGGGGGGGVILQYHDRPGRPCSNNDADAGLGLGTWSDGEPGLTYIGEVDFDGDGLTWAEGDCEPAYDFAFPGAEELCNEIDDNCDGVVDEDCVFEDQVDPTDRNLPEYDLQGGWGWACNSARGSAGWLALLGVVPLLRRRRA